MSPDALPPILIADDDRDDRFMLQRALIKAAVENPVLTFTDGDDLIQFLAAGQARDACLLFLDLNMPRMTGFDVLAAMRRCGHTGRLRTVVVSSSTREEDAERAKQLGAADYLVKFPSPAMLAKVVAAASRGGSEFFGDEPARPQNGSRGFDAA
jgi:CheY-like chemotaxis protein